MRNGNAGIGEPASDRLGESGGAFGGTPFTVSFLVGVGVEDLSREQSLLLS